MTPQPAPEPSDEASIDVEPLCAAKVFSNQEDPRACVLQVTTPNRHVFLELTVQELGRFAERLVLDHKILSSGEFSGNA